MGAPATLTQPTTQQIQMVQGLAHLYSLAAEELTEQSFGTIAYKLNSRGSVPVPTGFLLEGITAHFHLDVTLFLNAVAAPALSYLAQYAAVEEGILNYNGSTSTIWAADSVFAAQRMDMEFPNSQYEAAFNVPTPAGATTAYPLDWYMDLPAVYSENTLMGVLNENSNDVHTSIAVQWGDVANVYALTAGQTATATGYVEFIAKRQSAPQNPAVDGAPDLSKNYVVTYQDFVLNSSGKNKLFLDASDTITRMTLNMLEGGTGNGSDIASYDTTNALQVTNVKLGWSTNITKFDSPYWYWQQRAAKWYGRAFSKWINRGTVVIDLDKTGGRDWIDASQVTSLALTVELGAAPPAGSKCRVTLEQIVNTSDVPIR